MFVVLGQAKVYFNGISVFGMYANGFCSSSRRYAIKFVSLDWFEIFDMCKLCVMQHEDYMLSFSRLIRIRVQCVSREIPRK